MFAHARRGHIGRAAMMLEHLLVYSAGVLDPELWPATDHPAPLIAAQDGARPPPCGLLTTWQHASLSSEKKQRGPMIEPEQQAPRSEGAHQTTPEAAPSGRVSPPAPLLLQGLGAEPDSSLATKAPGTLNVTASLAPAANGVTPPVGSGADGTVSRTPAAASESQLHPKWMLIAGLIIFVLNIAVAWWMTSAAADHIRAPLGSDGSPSAKAIELMGTADMAQAVVLRGVIDGELHMKAISNKQNIVIVAVAAAFSFMAIGFALLVMGIREAFVLSARAPQQAGSLVLRSASPGLLCFVLAASIILVAVVQKTQLTFGPIEITPEQMGAPAATSSWTPGPIEKLPPQDLSDLDKLGATGP